MKMENYFFVKKSGFIAINNEIVMEESLHNRFLLDDEEALKIIAKKWAITGIKPGKCSCRSSDEIRLIGILYGHDRINDGDWSQTSPIVYLDEDESYVITKNGAKYDLGKAYAS